MMTYKELLQQLQQLNEDELQNQVIIWDRSHIWDLYKKDGYSDVQFDINNLTITFAEK